MSQDLDKIALHQWDLWFLALFALALHSFIVAMSTHLPMKKLSLRVSLVSVLGTLPTFFLWLERVVGVISISPTTEFLV
jgi:hypothetical protein